MLPLLQFGIGDCRSSDFFVAEFRCVGGNLVASPAVQVDLDRRDAQALVVPGRHSGSMLSALCHDY